MRGSIRCMTGLLRRGSIRPAASGPNAMRLAEEIVAAFDGDETRKPTADERPVTPADVSGNGEAARAAVVADHRIAVLAGAETIAVIRCGSTSTPSGAWGPYARPRRNIRRRVAKRPSKPSESTFAMRGRPENKLH